MKKTTAITMSQPFRPISMSTSAGIKGMAGQVILTGPITSDPAKGLTVEGLISAVGWQQEVAKWKDEPLESIEFIINSAGGDLIEGFGMHDYIKSLPCKTTARIIGACGSAMTLPALACNTRIIGANGTWFMHQPQGAAAGSTNEIIKTAETMQAYTDRMIKIYAETSGNTPEAVGEMLKGEVWLIGQQAVDGGWCDELDGQGGKTDDAETRAEGIVARGMRKFMAAMGLSASTDESDEDENQSVENAGEEEEENQNPPEDDDTEDEDDDDENVPQAVGMQLFKNVATIAAQARMIKDLKMQLGQKAVADQTVMETEIQKRVTASLAAAGMPPDKLPAAGADPQAVVEGTPLERMSRADNPHEMSCAAKDLLAQVRASGKKRLSA